jgi:hypothetical protein
MQGKRLLTEVRSVLSYDPMSGEFRWLIQRNKQGGRIEIGDVAGTDKDGYVQIGYKDSGGVKHTFRAHRLAFWFVTGSIPKEIDHIDRNRSNNAWVNLREVTRPDNNRNTHRLRANNVSGKRGVSWVAERNQWMARIVLGGRPIHLGMFADLDAAVSARRAAEIEHLGGVLPS